MCTILGQHISLIRPCRVAIMRPGSSGETWKGAKRAGRKTHKLSLEMKREIARQMGFELATEGRPLKETR